MSESRHQTKPQISSPWTTKKPFPDCPDADAAARADQSSSGNITSCSHVLPKASGESLRARRRTFRYSCQSAEAMGRTNSTVNLSWEWNWITSFYGSYWPIAEVHRSQCSSARRGASLTLQPTVPASTKTRVYFRKRPGSPACPAARALSAGSSCSCFSLFPLRPARLQACGGSSWFIFDAGRKSLNPLSNSIGRGKTMVDDLSPAMLARVCM